MSASSLLSHVLKSSIYSHFLLDVSKAPPAGLSTMELLIFSLTPQAPHLKDSFSHHPELCPETWESCLMPPCPWHALLNPSAGPTISASKSVLESSAPLLLSPPPAKPPSLVTQTLQRHPQLLSLLPPLPLPPAPSPQSNQRAVMETEV